MCIFGLLRIHTTLQYTNLLLDQNKNSLYMENLEKMDIKIVNLYSLEFETKGGKCR